MLCSGICKRTRTGPDPTRIRPDPVYYQGLDPTTDFVDLEVEAQLIKDAIYVRTRINSYRAPLVPNDPALPPALGLDRASVERHHVFETKGPSSLWHELYIPVHLNAHAVWVDGKPTRPARPAEILPWPAPAWTTIQVGDVVPGGLAEDRGDYSKGFLVSDLRVTTFRPGGGLEAVKQALAPQPGHPYAPPAMSTRYRRRGSDVMGSLRLRTRPLPPGARVGAVVVNEYVPKTFNQHVFHDADFLTQVSSRTRGGPLRRHVSGRVIPPPAPARFADPHFRYWRLRWLDEYCARMRRRAAHYRRLVELARGDAAALPALQAALAQVEESLRTLGAERDGLLSAYGREPAPRGASANDPERVLPQQASDCLDLQLDFLFLNQLAVPLADGFEQAHVALTIDEVIVPVATGARVLARRWE
ncbi:MAG TPA: hypothetical protein DEA08_13915 [Planctomycetes bacterium]|nr:hypothetical protein [Planctomycetota bacterium]